ncbi:MAG: hypothetical protein ACPLXS_02325 [Candidatus Micrarchaeales archaeon]
MHELYYFFGFWKALKGEKGISIKTKDLKKLKKFERVARKLGQEKFIRTKEGLLFYNSKLKKNLKKLEEKEEKIFRKKDQKTKEFLKGLYEASARRKNNKLYLKLSLKDAIVIQRIGFKLLEDKNGFYVFSEDEFLDFINR